MGGWKGIKRNRPIPPPKKFFDKPQLVTGNPVELENFTSDFKYDEKGNKV